MWVIFIILVLRNNRKIRNEEGREQSNTPENEPQVILGSIPAFSTEVTVSRGEYLSLESRQYSTRESNIVNVIL